MLLTDAAPLLVWDESTTSSWTKVAVWSSSITDASLSLFLAFLLSIDEVINDSLALTCLPFDWKI